MNKKPKWSFTWIDNGGGRQVFFVRGIDKTEAIENGFKRAKKHAKGDCIHWDCRLSSVWF